MKKTVIFTLLLMLLFFVGCSKEEPSTYDSLVQTFIDVNYGHNCPTKETIKNLRHSTMRGNLDEQYDAYVESWKENNTVLREVFGENYTYSVKVLSSTGDTRAMEDVMKFLNRQVTYGDGYITAYCNLKLEITFSGNGRTYVAEGKLEVIASDQWYMTDSLLESVENFR